MHMLDGVPSLLILAPRWRRRGAYGRGCRPRQVHRVRAHLGRAAQHARSSGRPRGAAPRGGRQRAAAAVGGRADEWAAGCALCVGGGEQLQHLHHQTCQTVSQMTVSRASTEFTDECTLDQTWPRHAQQARACCLAPTAPWSEMALLRRAVGPGGSLARLRLRLLSSYGVYSATAPGAPAAPTAAAAAAAGAANATGGSSSRRGGRKPDAGARGVGLGSLVLLAPLSFATAFHCCRR